MCSYQSYQKALFDKAPTKCSRFLKARSFEIYDQNELSLGCTQFLQK